jgi:hypothetical protein
VKGRVPFANMKGRVPFSRPLQFAGRGSPIG